MSQCSWRLSGVPSMKSRLLSCLMCNKELLCILFRGIRPDLKARGKSNCFSRVAAGTCIIFSGYDGDGPSRLMYVQRCQDSCLLARDNSGFSLRLGRAVGAPLEVRREIQGPFPDATWILGSLSLFQMSQASSPFEAWNSAWLSSSQ